MINSSTKLQNQFLGKESPLSENSKSQLFNAINSRSMDRIAKPIGEAIVEYGAAELVGPWVEKAFGKLIERFAARNAATVAKGVTQYSEDLVKAAQKIYPKKAGTTQLHHITPKYLGGAKNGPLVPLDGAYHQMITNEFRAL